MRRIIVLNKLNIYKFVKNSLKTIKKFEINKVIDSWRNVCSSG
ncbi:MAG: hypothetical protein ABIL76_07610 [candidate division WOR-3 bacterium]